jgi:uncharacterized membrane protein YfcA
VIFSSPLALALAALIGVTLGVLGSGGSIVTLPVLVYIAHVPAKEAVGMSMAIVGATSLFGALIHWRRGNVAPKAALIFSVVGMAGSFLGSAGTHLLSKRALLLLFAGVMLIVGSIMLRGGSRLDPNKACQVPRCLLVGFAVGLLTGFLGVGGGFLIVPALVLTAGLNTRMAGGTSLAVIAMNSTTGLLGQLRYVSVDWSLLAGFLLFAFAGMLAGIAFARRLHEKLLRRLFAIALIVLAVVLALLNL